MDDFVGWIIIGVGILLALWLLFSVVHIVREYERLVVFFFGRLQGARGPGIVLLIPFVQQAVKVDLRERFLEVPQQTCITKDNAPISIDFLVYSKVFEPEVTVTAVVDFTGASQALAATRCAPSSATSRSTTCWQSGSRSTMSCAPSSTR